MSTPLDPTGNLITVGNVRLRAPGLAGDAESYPPAPPAFQTGGAASLRSAQDVEQTTEAFETALANQGIERQETVEIRAPQEIPLGGGAADLRTTAYDEAAIEMQVPAPNDDWGQFVLSVDESGVTTWNFAQVEAPAPTAAAAGLTRGETLRTYLVPRYAPAAPAEELAGGAAEVRGLLGSIGSKLLKVLVFPLIDPILGRISETFAARWEAANRPYRIRTFDPADYNQANATPIDGQRWSDLSRGRALLMVHGTFSRAHTAFAGLPADVVQKLHEIYQHRVFAFDHYTLSDDPEQNIRWFVDHIPDGTRLELDIICHSRGGLVSRALAEKQSLISLGSRQLRIGRIVFVAAPNSGTILTDSQYMGDLLDSYTNLLNLVPSNGATEILEGVVTVAKMLAVGALHGLPGLQSMLPKGPFLTAFNNAPKGDDRYFALASDYEPQNPGLKAWALSRLATKIFQKAQNDLVVPTLGVYDQNGCGYFPIADTERHVFGPADNITHGDYFGNPQAQQLILQWLG